MSFTRFLFFVDWVVSGIWSDFTVTCRNILLSLQKLKRESKYLCYKAIFNESMDGSLYQKILLQRPPWQVTESFDEG